MELLFVWLAGLVVGAFYGLMIHALLVAASSSSKFDFECQEMEAKGLLYSADKRI